MSRIQSLSNSPKFNINLIKFLQIIFPDVKTKYIDAIAHLYYKAKVDNKENIKEWYEDSIEIGNIFSKSEKSKKEIENLDPLQLFFLYRFTRDLIDDSFALHPNLFSKFIEYNERGLIPNNDLSTYSSPSDYMSAVNIAELKVIEKDLETQVKMIYSDEEWVILRPLTWVSSKKYGSQTRWCTTNESGPAAFYDYAGRGILIYNINKKSGLKVAIHSSSIKDNENMRPMNQGTIDNLDLSCWNMGDDRVDSIVSGLPDWILRKNIDEIKSSPVPNISLSEEAQKLYDDYHNVSIKRDGILELHPVERTIYAGAQPEEDEPGIITQEEYMNELGYNQTRQLRRG